MKDIKLKYSGTIILTLLMLFSFFANVVAQENEQEVTVDDFRMLFYLNTTKQADNSRMLEVEFLARNKENKKDKIAVVDADIQFFNVTEDDEILLGTAKTDKKGFASLQLAEDQAYITDADGYISFLARFEGNDVLDEEEADLMLKDLKLELELAVEDGIQMVYVKAYTQDSLGEETPVEELDIIIGVQGMLSKMPLDEGSLEEGEYEFEMPMDIPGDNNGDLEVYVQVDDHEDFINVFKMEKAAWGTYNKNIKSKKNTLWSDGAPIWMYIVLTIMLLGIWAFYGYTIINLMKIKKMGNN